MVHWYKRDPDAALAGMAELSLVDRGAYNSLLDVLYSRDNKVLDDDVAIARMMNCDVRQWKGCKERLVKAGKIWVVEGRIEANRVEKTIKDATKIMQHNTAAARARWGSLRALPRELSDSCSTAVQQLSDSSATSNRQVSEKVSKNNDGVMPTGIPPHNHNHNQKESYSDSLFEEDGGPSRTFMSELDFRSADGSVFFAAHEIDQLQAELPAIRDVRAQLRHACRGWAANIDPPSRRKPSIIKGLRKKHVQLLEKKATAARIADQSIPFAERQTHGEFGRVPFHIRAARGDLDS